MYFLRFFYITHTYEANRLVIDCNKPEGHGFSYEYKKD